MGRLCREIFQGIDYKENRLNNMQQNTTWQGKTVQLLKFMHEYFIVKQNKIFESKQHEVFIKKSVQCLNFSCYKWPIKKILLHILVHICWYTFQ